MKAYFTFLLFLLVAINSIAQKLSIVVYKGPVSLDNKTLLFNTRYEIPTQAMVQYGPKSQFTIFSKTKIYKKTSPDGATQTYSQILANLNAQAPTGFLKLMDTYKDFSEIETATKGSAVGAAKGLNDRKDAKLLDNDEMISPTDSAKTGAKSITLNWKTKNSFLAGRLYVIHQQTQDTIYNQPATQIGTANIAIEKPGIYNWFIYSKIDKKKRINQCFIRLSEEENEKLKSDFENFKKEIAILDTELQEILIEDYKAKFGIID